MQRGKAAGRLTTRLDIKPGDRWEEPSTQQPLAAAR